MKLTVGQLRQIVQEERARLHEGFYPGQFAGMDPDDIVNLVSAAERRGMKIKVSKEIWNIYIQKMPSGFWIH